MHLLLDCTNRYLVLVLFCKNKIIDTYFSDNYRKHSENLLCRLDEFLGKNNTTLSAIKDRLYVCSGPGSYSGVRICLTFAKTLQMCQPNLQVYVLSTNLLFHDFRSKQLLVNHVSPRQNYVVLVSSGSLVSDFCLYTDDQLQQFCKEHSNFRLVNCYLSINQVIDCFFVKINHFKFYPDLQDLAPLFCKTTCKYENKTKFS